MNMNLPTIASIPAVPGIDDCDHIFNCSSRDGEESIYLRAHEFEFEGRTLYATAISFDGVRTTHDLPCPAYAFNLEQAANWTVETAREQWGKGKFCQCSDTRRMRTI